MKTKKNQAQTKSKDVVQNSTNPETIIKSKKDQKLKDTIRSKLVVRCEQCGGDSK